MPEPAIATPHADATAAGRRAFAAGGTAVDAALAAAAVLTVVYPHKCALGGDLFALVREPDGTIPTSTPAGPRPRGPTGRAALPRPGRDADHGAGHRDRAGPRGRLGRAARARRRAALGGGLQEATATAQDGAVVVRSLGAALAEADLSDPGMARSSRPAARRSHRAGAAPAGAGRDAAHAGRRRPARCTRASSPGAWPPARTPPAARSPPATSPRSRPDRRPAAARVLRRPRAPDEPAELLRRPAAQALAALEAAAARTRSARTRGPRRSCCSATAARPPARRPARGAVDSTAGSGRSGSPSCVGGGAASGHPRRSSRRRAATRSRSSRPTARGRIADPEPVRHVRGRHPRARTGMRAQPRHGVLRSARPPSELAPGPAPAHTLMPSWSCATAGSRDARHDGRARPRPDPRPGAAAPARRRGAQAATAAPRWIAGGWRSRARRHAAHRGRRPGRRARVAGRRPRRRPRGRPAARLRVARPRAGRLWPGRPGRTAAPTERLVRRQPG